MNATTEIVDLLIRGHWEDLYECIVELREDGELFSVFPELAALDIVDTCQGATHKNVLEHTFEVLANLRDILAKEYAEKGQDYYRAQDNALVLGALLHDIGKPQTKEFSKDKKTWTFYAHEEVGWQMLPAIFSRLEGAEPIPQRLKDTIAIVVRYHQLPSQLESVADKGLRKFLDRVGANLREVLLISRADITSANPMKVLRGRQKVDDLELKLEEFRDREKLRLLRVDISNQEIADMLNIENKVAAHIKTRIKELVNEGRLVNTHEKITNWIKENYSEHQ